MDTPSIKPTFIDSLKEEMLSKKVPVDKIDIIIHRLKILNDNYPFNNLAFLKEIDTIKERLSVFKLLAQVDILKSVIIVLKLNKDKPFYASTYDDYVKLRYTTTRAYNKEKNDRKKELFNKSPKWSDLKSKRDEIVVPNKIKSKEDYDSLLEYMIASIYVDMLPRKNQDYQYMVINKKEKDGLSEDCNHLLIQDKKMIFNKYTGYKMGGQQIIQVPDNIMVIINKYLKYHPLYKSNKNDVQFLVDYDGKPLKTINYITRILNKVFGKGISAQSLKKIYIKDKYGDNVPIELLLEGFRP